LVKTDFLAKWAQSGIDVLITPVTPFTAPTVNFNPFLLNQLTFCGFPNVLEMPSGTVPVRLVK
jgi:Asp-tRNA(Asn)/Glu-tRNA(Gln) amidotransferase A subunit family amidase